MTAGHAEDKSFRYDLLEERRVNPTANVLKVHSQANLTDFMSGSG